MPCTLSIWGHLGLHPFQCQLSYQNTIYVESPRTNLLVYTSVLIALPGCTLCREPHDTSACTHLSFSSSGRILTHGEPWDIPSLYFSSGYPNKVPRGQSAPGPCVHPSHSSSQSPKVTKYIPPTQGITIHEIIPSSLRSSCTA